MSNIFVKTNQLNNRALHCESEGLNALREHIHTLKLTYIRIPEVISVSNTELKLERIHYVQPNSVHMRLLAQDLAHFHAAKGKHYGWPENNFIGLSKQTNRLDQNWGEFFIQFRLVPQLHMMSSVKMREHFHDILLSKRHTLADYLNNHCSHPSLLHGDMWNGNVLFDENNAWLIDPAIYYGDSEVDIAMSEMFGGFSTEFYSFYNQSRSLSSEYPRKKQIYNLYHYLNHLNLFGSGYIDGCERGFDVISKL